MKEAAFEITHLISTYGNMVYLIIFLIIACETGLVFAAFLPGDSLVFASGALAASGILDIWILYLVVSIASIAGNCLSYLIGVLVGEKLIIKCHGKLLNKENVEKTHIFYQKYGALALPLSRFMPVVRSLAPFMAGVGEMKFFKFLIFNSIGSIIWGSFFVTAGYFAGNVKLLQNNFWIMSLVSLFIPFVSVVVFFVVKKLRGGK